MNKIFLIAIILCLVFGLLFDFFVSYIMVDSLFPPHDRPFDIMSIFTIISFICFVLLILVVFILSFYLA